MRSATDRQPPWALIITATLLLAVGLFNLYSASRVSIPRAFYMQLVWLGAGVALSVPMIVIDYRVWERLGKYLWIITALLLVAVLFSKRIAGSHRWLLLGPVRLQPSELAKVVLILTLAQHFQEEGAPGPYNLKQLLKPLFFILGFVGLVVVEPDLGTSLIIMFVGVTMVLVAGVERRTLLGFAVAAIVAVPLAWIYGLKDYQKTRILTLLSAGGADTKGAGYHAYQSLIAVGSGEVAGKGYLQGTQNMMRFLPEQHTDFAFAVFAEEFGFIGSVALMALFVAFLILSLRVAWLAREKFGIFVATGITTLFALHVFINIGMVTGMLPVVGMTLPFFSYGGSSLMMFVICTALLINIHMRRQMF